MSQQTINIGAAPEDGTGDQLRVAFDKCNDNFTELYTTGAATSVEGVWNFNQTSTDTTTSPSSGRFRTNSGNAASATQLAIHRLSINGFDRADTLRTQHVGDIIKLQDKTNADSWARFTVQATPVDNVDWFQIDVAFDSGGGTAPGNNQEILFTFLASSGGGGGGGNVSNVGTPTNGQIAQWTDATHIQGIAASTITTGLAPLASPTFTGDPQAPTPTAGDNDTSIATTAFVTAAVAAAGGSGGTATPPQGRLTLQTGTPVMTTTQAAKTTIYYTPYVGNMVPIYDGSNMVATPFTELSAATTDTTKSPAAIGASKVNDWFVWNDAGTLRVGHGPDWTNDTTRSAGTALTMVNGILLNNVTITNGPAAQRGTYVGTTRSNASSQLDWIYGTLAANGGAAVFGVWNVFNRVRVHTQVRDTTDSWTLATATVRPANNSTTMRCSYVCGLEEDAFYAQYQTSFSMAAVQASSVGVGYDSTTAYSGAMAFSNTAGVIMPGFGAFVTTSLGFHFFQALEGQGSTGTNTYYGDGGDPARAQNGLTVQLRM